MTRAAGGKSTGSAPVDPTRDSRTILPVGAFPRAAVNKDMFDWPLRAPGQEAGVLNAPAGEEMGVY